MEEKSMGGMRITLVACAGGLMLAWAVGALFSSALALEPKPAGCPPFYLKAEDGQIINPITGQNADKPYSTKQTCGACHDYVKITGGYHFQQGWDEISDDFGLKKGKPWVLSPGMMGKH